METILNYCSSLDIFGWLQIVAMVIGFIYVLLQVKKTRKMWYFWLASSVLNIFVYFHSGFYAMMALQFYYIVAAIYGLMQWNKTVAEAKEKYGQRKTFKEVLVRKFEWKKGLISFGVAIVAYICLVPLFKRFSEAGGTAMFASQPYWDTLLAVLSMLATYWLSQSYMAQWFIWIFVNAVSIVIFAMGGIYWFSVLYVAYLVLAIIGIINWKRNAQYVD